MARAMNGHMPCDERPHGSCDERSHDACEERSHDACEKRSAQNTHGKAVPHPGFTGKLNSTQLQGPVGRQCHTQASQTHSKAKPNTTTKYDNATQHDGAHEHIKPSKDIPNKHPNHPNPHLIVFFHHSTRFTTTSPNWRPPFYSQLANPRRCHPLQSGGLSLLPSLPSICLCAYAAPLCASATRRCIAA